MFYLTLNSSDIIGFFHTNANLKSSDTKAAPTFLTVLQSKWFRRMFTYADCNAYLMQLSYVTPLLQAV
jgi:hypothetical protein